MGSSLETAFSSAGMVWLLLTTEAGSVHDICIDLFYFHLFSKLRSAFYSMLRANQMLQADVFASNSL